MLFNFSNVYFTEPSLWQKQIKLLPFQRGIPPWIRHQAFIISVFLLNADTTDIFVYISWIILFNSLSAIVEEACRLRYNKGTENLQNEIAIHGIPGIYSSEYFDCYTWLLFFISHSAICIACIAYSCLSVAIVYVFPAIIFVCVSNTQVQLRMMSEFGQAYSYAMDGLVEYGVLGNLILIDVVITSSLFVVALYSGRSHLLVTITYCNVFAALMELCIRAWFPLKNERVLVRHMRWATKEELMSHNDICAVCLVHMTSARVTVCQHLFHGKCLRLSLKVNTQCPMCKSVLLPSLGHGHMF